MNRFVPDGRPVVTQVMIEAGLRDLGLGPGDIVIAHSALRSFGRSALMPGVAQRHSRISTTVLVDAVKKPRDPLWWLYWSLRRCR